MAYQFIQLRLTFCPKCEKFVSTQSGACVKCGTQARPSSKELRAGK